MTLGACSAATSQLLLGTAVTPVARRRVQNLAPELATLSLASGGRVVFGAGLGGLRQEFEAFGEDGDERERARGSGTSSRRSDWPGCISHSAHAEVGAYEAAGATWWLENVHGSPEDVLARVREGPPLP